MTRELNGKTLTWTMTPAELVETIRSYDNPNSCGKYGNEGGNWQPYNWADTWRFLEYGWEEGVGILDIRADEVASGLGMGTGAHIERDVTGDFFDVGLVLSGEPECWSQMTVREAPTQQATVFVNNAFNCTIKQEYVYNRGAAAVNVIDNLRQRYHVKVIIHTNGYGVRPKDSSYRNLHINIEIDTQNHYSRGLIAFLIANPCFHRRVWFCLLEMEEGRDECHGDGYGSPMNPIPKEADDHWLMFGQVNNDNERDFKTVEKAVETTKEMLAAYEAKITGAAV